MIGLYPELVLVAGKEKAVERKHPWIFSGAIKRKNPDLKDGDIAEVFDSKGNYCCTGHYFDGNITVKIFAFKQAQIDRNFWKNKIENAWRLRLNCGILQQSSTNCCRILHGEGDGMPGLIADLYADTLVLQAHSIGMYRILEVLADIFVEVSKGSIQNVYNKSREHLPEQYAAQIKDGFIIGESQALTVKENSHQFYVDVVTGQKTGFFLDQRDNRALLGAYSAGKSVLNTFAYSGGFSIYALKNGALKVDSVDVSSRATELIERNIALNHLQDAHHRTFTEDTYNFLKNNQQQYDIVILDPPAFAKSISKRHNAVQGYKRLNILGMQAVKSGGLLFTFSCSQVVDHLLFYNTITAAAIESGREVRILHQLFQPADHPVNIFHPEGSYLKGLVAEIL